MKTNFRWVVLDTETDGFYEPVNVIEIAAQAMEGWAPVGDPFRVLINHGVQIDSQAERVHGYTQEFLEENGLAPIEAHQLFASYVGDSPVVSHNMAFDWDRALVPEWGRLGMPSVGKRGFCTLKLSRRLVPEAAGHNLEALKALFELGNSLSHKAQNDVEVLVEYLRKVISPRSRRLALDSFEMVAAFSELDVKRAHAAVSSIYGKDVVEQSRRKRLSRAEETPQARYRVARQGAVLGEYTLGELKLALKAGEVLECDDYWSAGMVNSWAKLGEIIALIQSSGPKMASKKQVVYLQWLGANIDEPFTEISANVKIKELEANLASAPGARIWDLDRLVLHPDLFDAELNRHISGKIRKECLRYYDGVVFGSSDYPDLDTCKAVFQKLGESERAWWSKPNFQSVFYDMLQHLYPKCCDGKSVYMEKVLPENLHSYVRSRYVRCSEKLTKSKIREVIESLSNDDSGWHTVSGFEDLFLQRLKDRYPGCCDGRDPGEVYLERVAEEVACVEAEISEIVRQVDLTESNPSAMQVLAEKYFRLSFLNQSTSHLKLSYEWMNKAAEAGSWSAARFMINYVKSSEEFSPPTVQLRAWLRFVALHDRNPLGLADLESHGTTESETILSIFNVQSIYGMALDELDSRMTESQVIDSEKLLVCLSSRISDFR